MEQRDAILHAKAIEIGKLAVRSTTAARTGTPALSLALLVTALMYQMYQVTRSDPSRPENPDADRLVLSDGHAARIIYAARADLGAVFALDGRTRPLTIADLDRLRAIESPLDGHPNPRVGVLPDAPESARRCLDDNDGSDNFVDPASPGVPARRTRSAISQQPVHAWMRQDRQRHG